MAILLSSSLTFAQTKKKYGFQGNVYAGVPVGMIASDSYLNTGFSVGYLGEVEEYFRVGGSIGYDYSFLKNSSHLPSERGFKYIMVGATAELDVYQNFYFAADLGYAFSQAKRTAGSHYITPKIGYHFNEDFNFYLHYKGVRYSFGQVASIGIGAAYKF